MYHQKAISKKLRKKIICCRYLEGHWRKEQDPDPLVRSTDPRIRIHTKMAQNTGAYFGGDVPVIITIRLLKKHLRLKEKIGIPAPFNNILSLKHYLKIFFIVLWLLLLFVFLFSSVMCTRQKIGTYSLCAD